MLDRKIELICEEVGATEAPTLYLTNTPFINNYLNKKRKWNAEELREFKPVFRHEVSTTGYKAGRVAAKPYHFYNLVVYMLAKYNVHVDENGLEADDCMAIEQYSRWVEGHKDTIICSRDKDLRQCPSWHYSWECGKQASIGPYYADPLGKLVHKNPDERDAKGHKKPAKIFGYGAKFFYYQLLAGDNVDTVKGAKQWGPTFSYNLLKDVDSIKECHDLVAAVYQKIYGDKWKAPFSENYNLVNIIKQLNPDGSIPLYKEL